MQDLRKIDQFFSALVKFVSTKNYQTLEAYGFSPKCKNWFKLHSKKLKANILENGFTTKSINIEQSVKQVDALLCSPFILCMDPLIRKVNGDNEIEGLNIGINGDYIDKVWVC